MREEDVGFRGSVRGVVREGGGGGGGGRAEGEGGEGEGVGAGVRVGGGGGGEVVNCDGGGGVGVGDGEGGIEEVVDCEGGGGVGVWDWGEVAEVVGHGCGVVGWRCWGLRDGVGVEVLGLLEMLV